MLTRRLLLAFALCAAACGDDDDDQPITADAPLRDGGTADAASADAGPPPITATANVWTWVDFPGAACDDGTATGIGVNLSPSSSNLLIYFEGGGACWDYLTCAVLNTSAHGPFGKTQFDARAAGLGGIFDRSAQDNPFKDWNLVYVPYCTGDIHGGDKVITYDSGSGQTKTMHHVGHANVLAYLTRLVPTFPAPAKLVVTGSSAGGFGSVLSYVSVRDALHPAKSYLIDDSGPLLVGDDVNLSLRTAFYASWNLGASADELCGTACRDDFSAGLTALSTRYPSDRMALLSSLRDLTIRTYVMLTPESFEAAVRKLATDVLEETTNFKYFYTPGDTHTMLSKPQDFTSSSTPLWDWLGDMVGDDAGWVSTMP